MSETKTSNFWLDLAADEIIRRYPDGEIIVSSGISPSASYHIGHFREIMTAEALTWAVRQRGRQARHLHVVDDFDPLRKRYDFLPKEFEQYVGWPISLVPNPTDSKYGSYADHFFAEFEQHLEPMGIKPEIIRSYRDLYQPGKMAPYITQALSKVDRIREIFKAKSNRELPADWTPVTVLQEDNRFAKGELNTFNKDKETINDTPFNDGRVKLDWRLDWPARWALLGVQVEPFGAQEHGASGSSYDTGVDFARDIFGIEPPYDAARYGHIHRPGENIKMSSSKGNGVTPEEALKIMPAEILRYFIVRSRPERKLIFDPGQGLYNLIDEFAAVQDDPDHEFRDAYNFAVAGDTKRVISSVPFKHLVQVYQAAQGDEGQTLEVLRRTDYKDEVENERDIIIAELTFVKNWLEKYAPDEVKFQVQKELPQADLSAAQQKFLDLLATKIEDHSGDIDGQTMHQLIYAAKDEAELQPKEAFQALYQVILGKLYGPKAGWFLASLDRDWLTKRLKRQS
ncbi:lysine--tRNA ligase [Patescibacteria group bacterium]|nr:MAG: lysine--tRNA ligase [Patescibacteria group bacterium]